MKRIYTSLVALVALLGFNTAAFADELTLTPSETTEIRADGDASKEPQYENTNGDNNYYNAEATFWLCSQTNISGGQLNNQNKAYGGSYAVITKFDASTTLAGMNIQKATLKFNSVCTASGKNSNVIVASIGTDWDATTVTWNNMDRTATQISAGTGTNVKTSTTLTEDVTELLSNDEDKVIAFAIYTYTAREQKITNITLEVEAVDASSSAEVKLLYVDLADNELKTETAVGAAGSTLSLTNDQKANFFVNDNKYIYVSDNSADVVIAGDGTSVVKLVYREAAKWNYSLIAVDGSNNVLKTVANGAAPEGENINVGYPAYIDIDGALWTTGKGYSNDGKGFTTSVSLTQDNVEKNLTYTDKGIANVVYLSEAENIEGMIRCNTSNAGIRSSNAAAAYAPNDVTFTRLAAGKYQLYAIIYDAQKSANSTWEFKAGVMNIASINCTTINYWEAPAVDFAIGKETDITIVKGGANNRGLDLIYIVKTGDVTEEEAAELNAAAEAAEALIAAKADLEAAINEAKAIETEGKEGVDELNAAIAAAEEALAAEDATVETLTAAKAALAEAVAAFNEANTIKIVIANADFSESTPIDNNLCGYGKDMAAQNTTYYGLQDITGWEKFVISGDNATAAYPNSGMGGAVFAYGSEWQMKGNNVAAPAAGPNGEEGNALGFFAVWGLGGYYAQDVTLPAGKYTMVVPIYNQSGTQANESYTGFFVKDSDVKYTVAVNPTPGSWAMQTVEFTLNETTEGQIRLGYKSAGSGSGANPMIFIDGVQLMSELDAAIVVYNTALAAAQNAFNDEAYAVVTGEERTTLSDAITANIDMTSVEALKAAAEALKAAAEALKAAKGNYQALVDAKAFVATLSFEYAAADKKTAAEEAATAVATNAADAADKKDALLVAYRLFAESSALLEGKEDAVNMTDVIVNPAAESAIAAPWTVVKGEGSGGSLDTKSNEPWTDGDGNTAHKYFDGGNWGANAWDVTMKQDITLPAGKYQLTVKSRCSAELDSFNVFVGEEKVEMIKMGAADGLFNRGWNDNSVVFELEEEATVTIGVQGVTTTIHTWMSFSDFRLVQFPAGGEVVGIANVNANDLQNGTIYNLRGQRVEKATKGLYIVNGKKVVMK